MADDPPEGQPIDDRSIGGFSDVTVTVGNGQTSSPMPAPQPSEASATRTIDSTINAGEEVTVIITVADYGGVGEVVEVLPEGFTYVSTTHEDLLREGQRLSFSLVGEESFRYTVTAPTRTGSYDFDGTLTYGQLMETRVGGVFAVTVQTPALPRGSATRSFSPSPVNPGGQLTVTITLGNYGGVGEVVEVLPEGFTYVSTTHEDLLREGQRLSFSLVGEESFRYTVTAPTRTGSYDFDGTLTYGQLMETRVGGVFAVRVGTPPSRPAPAPAPANNPPTFPMDPVIYTIAENSPPGTNVGEPVTATDPDGDTLTYTLGGADVADFRIDSTSGQITVGPDTSLDFETKSMYALAVMASDGNVSVATSVIINLTDVDEAPPADPCVNDLGGRETVTGTWSGDCASENRLGRYANFFSFTLEEATEVTIDLTSAEDTYLYLLEGMGRDGMVLHENDDVAPGTNSQIQETLAAGTYTIEATTWGSGVTGSFTLTVSGLGDGTTPTPTPGPMPTDDPCRQTLPGDDTVTGDWADDCESAVGARGYARYYTFTLAEESEVTITLESDTDPYLYLREGEAKSGDFLHENDDIVLVTNTNSRIEETLMAGTYTIEATTYGFGEMGSFTLTVSGLGDVTMPTPPQEPMPTDDPCRQTLSGAGTSNGMWASACESASKLGSYARYYTFTLTEASEVTITLESDTDPYLYLREGEAKSGDAVDENDDVVPGTDTNSRIQVTLVAGTYTIEATTYGVGEMGSFTLTVSGW